VNGVGSPVARQDSTQPVNIDPFTLAEDPALPCAFKARNQRPRIRVCDRVFWVLLRRLCTRWSDALMIVKPDTVVRWHRAGFRVFWSWISRRRGCQGRPAVDAEVRELIRRMAVENAWGAPRIHGELRMLGFDVSERTVSRRLRELHRRPEARQSWTTFLHNHRELIAAMDLFVVFTATFRLLYVFLVIQHGCRQIVRFNVTEHPTAAWVAQQMREAFPFDSAPKRLIFDRDSIFSAEVVHIVKAMGMTPTRTSYSAPWQNGLLERWIGGARVARGAPGVRTRRANLRGHREAGHELARLSNAGLLAPPSEGVLANDRRLCARPARYGHGARLS
jgi:putative transposase